MQEYFNFAKLEKNKRKWQKMDAKELFAKLYASSSDALVKFQSTALSPNKEKKLKEWGITDAGAMIGRTPQSIRVLEDQGKIPQARKIQKSKKEERVYSLGEINHIRDFLGTRPRKPKNVPPLTIAITNFKGGVTKSTTAITVAQNFALKGYRVLVVDGDNQATETHLHGLIPDNDIKSEETLLDILIGDSTDIKKIIRKTHWDGLDLIPANLSLYNAEMIIPAQIYDYQHTHSEPLAFYRRLYDAFQQINDDYDLIIFDAPPSLGCITMNLLYAANAILIPLPPQVVDFSSTIQFLNMLQETFDKLPKINYSFVRILLTRYKTASASAREMEGMIRQCFGQYVLSNHVIESEAVAKAAANLKTIYEMEPHANERKTYERVIQSANHVCDEIEMLMKITWRSYVQHQQQTLHEEVRG